MQWTVEQLQERLREVSAESGAGWPVFFGGSFDPFHRGHAAVAAALHRYFSPWPVTLLPNRVSPLKVAEREKTETAKKYTGIGSRGREIRPDGVQKIGLMEAVIQDLRRQLRLPLQNSLPGLELWELQREGPSYTAETLRHLLAPSSQSGGKACVLALGMDSFCTLKQWKDWPYLLDTCVFIVFRRDGKGFFPDGFCPDGEIEARADYLMLDLDEPYSSTAIRQRLVGLERPPREAERRELEYVLGENQLRYILEHGLYRLGESRSVKDW
ncbi:hypothetical protein P0082_10155 [Candidatus Haliotispira prima]|uniref:Probable nicotinate-nucleotide adenylyltransferase n=1 Tax=Candidatus Haliotispira prima TaxID=3034016 RepID=A0ABY8MFX4_9SPIO|nr:hypothetical protein P0082_10155 [Candidatus Haliotispira prima]